MNSSIKKNIIYNVSYQILIIIIPLITAPYISRVLGVEGVGTYSYIYSIAYYFGLFGMLGISNHGNRTIALTKKNKEDMSEHFWNLYSIQFIVSLISLICYLVFVFFIFKGNKSIAFIDVFFVLSYMFDITWLFFGLEQFKTTVLRSTILKIATLITIFLFVKVQTDLWKYCLILGVGTFLSQLYLWTCRKKYIIFKKPSYSKIKENIKPVVLLFIPVLSYSIYKVMDKIMLGSIASIYQVGIYENSEKIIGIPTSIITALGTVMMPRISSLLSKNEHKEIEFINSNSFKYFSILAIAMTFGLISISNVLAPVYYGKKFYECSNTISILSISILFLTWANIIRTQYLIPHKKDKPYIISTIIGAIINLIANTLLIPKYGANGAAIGTVFAEFSVFVTQFLYTKNEFNVTSYLKCTAYIFPIGIIMTIIIKLMSVNLDISILTLVKEIIVGGLFFTTIIIAVLLITKDELAQNFIKKIKKVIIK